MRIYHEAPNSYFGLVQMYTDGDYALVHMLEKSERYKKLIFEAKRKGRDIILDNSAFELGQSFDVEKYVDWIYLLRPTYFIIPDKLRDAGATVDMMNEFFKYWPTVTETTGSKSIGVVQGTTYTECLWCYEQLVTRCDVIAFNKSYGEPEDDLEVRAQARPKLIRMLMEDGIIDDAKPHHILGTIYPQEMKQYASDEYSFIKSVDTCNPVVSGLLEIEYTPEGLDVAMTNQPKIDDWIEKPFGPTTWNTVKKNIEIFRRLCNAR